MKAKPSESGHMRAKSAIQLYTRQNNTWTNRKQPADFYILCPASARQSDMLAALYALQYLPADFKLMMSLPSNEARRKEAQNFITETKLTSRVVTEKTGLPETVSPFSFADVVVYGNATPAVDENMPAHSLVVFNIAASEAARRDGSAFTVCASNPEALASAVLQVTRQNNR